MYAMKELFGYGRFSALLKNRMIGSKLPFIGMVMMLVLFCTVTISSAVMEYEAADVDSPPKIVRQIPVKYPTQAKREGITGRVIVRCLVGTDGKAKKLEVVESEPAGIFDESALSNLKYCQFRPGIKGGELVATWVKVPFKFE